MVPILARSATAALLSLALAQPGAAQEFGPAQEARDRDRQGLVVGLAALAAVGFLLHERREDREEEREKEARRLPSDCLVTWSSRGRDVTLYDPDCLDASFAPASHLPLHCAVTVRSEGRFVSGFSPSCLLEEGWETTE